MIAAGESKDSVRPKKDQVPGSLMPDFADVVYVAVESFLLRDPTILLGAIRDSWQACKAGGEAVR